MTGLHRLPTIVLAVVLLVVPLAGSVSDAAAPAGTPGSAGIGDPYFPRQGNGGYDVSKYWLDLAYTPTGHKLGGTERIQATATQDLSRFDLDLRRNMVVSSLTIDGTAATWAQPAADVQELIITPAHPIADGTTFFVDLAYAGKATPVIDPDGSKDGFIPTDDGAFVASEPQGSPSWFAVNDTPTDKAVYKVSMTVPNGLSAIGNGAFRGITQNNGTKTWHWLMGRPIASYLVTATIGRFNLSFGTTLAGTPYVIAVDPRGAEKAELVQQKLPAMIDFFTKMYGAYPWGSAGAIVDHATSIGYALETATRPLFDQPPNELVLAHELAHQWFGDDVTVTWWRGIWLNEGFAEFSDWLWDEHRGGLTAHQHLVNLLKRPASSGDFDPPPGNPGSGENIFALSVYERGAGTLEALREKLGDATFFTILRGWVQAHAYGNATLTQFTTYAAQVSGQNLTAFFQNWLYNPGKPTS